MTTDYSDYSDYTKKIIKETYNRLPAVYKKKPKFVETLKKIVFLLTDGTGRLDIETNIDLATGYSLDIIGAKFNVKRAGLEDAQYRDAIKLEMALRVPDLSNKGLTQKIKLLFDVEQCFLKTIEDNIIFAYINFNSTPNNFNILSKIIPAGTNFVLKYTNTSIMYMIDDYGEISFGTPIAADSEDEGLLLVDENNTPIVCDVFETEQIY